jgi:TPP-dependent pyruvate/acetoin dehydrogenase alpha subunit
MDVGVKRSEELVLWKQRDPISRLAKTLDNQSFLSTEALTTIREEVDSLTTEALEQARIAPYPPDNQLLDCVYY